MLSGYISRCALTLPMTVYCNTVVTTNYCTYSNSSRNIWLHSFKFHQQWKTTWWCWAVA